MLQNYLTFFLHVIVVLFVGEGKEGGREGLLPSLLLHSPHHVSSSSPLPLPPLPPSPETNGGLFSLWALVGSGYFKRDACRGIVPHHFLSHTLGGRSFLPPSLLCLPCLTPFLPSLSVMSPPSFSTSLLLCHLPYLFLYYFFFKVSLSPLF